MFVAVNKIWNESLQFLTKIILLISWSLPRLARDPHLEVHYMKWGDGEESQCASIPPCVSTPVGRVVGGWTPRWDHHIASSATGATCSMGNGEGNRTTAIIATGWRINDKFKHPVVLATLCCLPHPFLSLPPPCRPVWFVFGGNSMEKSSVGCLPQHGPGQWTPPQSRFPLVICPGRQGIATSSRSVCMQPWFVTPVIVPTCHGQHRVMMSLHRRTRG